MKYYLVISTVTAYLSLSALTLRIEDFDLSRYALPRKAKLMVQDMWKSATEKVSTTNEKKPDEDISYSRWAAEGIYALRVSPSTTHSGGDEGEDNENFETESLILYGFHKVYDEKEEKFRISAFPISSPVLTPDDASDSENPNRDRRAYRGPYEVIGKGDNMWMIYDLERDWERPYSSGEPQRQRDMVKCRRMRMKFRKMEPVKRGDYLGLSFEHNTLCNHYQNVHEDQHKKFGKWTCVTEHSELYIDAFGHEPVELHMEGKLIRSGAGGGNPSKEERRTIVHVFFKDFEFLTEREDKRLLEIPKNVEELCEGQEDFVDDLSEQDEMFVMAMLNQL